MAAMAIMQRGNAALRVDRTHGAATSAQFGPLRLTLAIEAMSDGLPVVEIAVGRRWPSNMTHSRRLQFC